MRICFFAKKREPDYLQQTLNSLECSDWRHTKIPVTIFLGGDDEDGSEYNYECIPWVGGDYGRPDNIIINHWRAITHYQTNVCVFEDDIQFGRNWMAKLFLAIEEIEYYRKKTNYCISMYTHRNYPKRGIWYCSYGETFYGSQGLYFPIRAINSIGDYLIQNMGRCNSDLLIGEWARKKSRMYTPLKSTIQHIGRSSGAKSPYHESHNFEA